jgi:hypothetical protein
VEISGLDCESVPGSQRLRAMTMLLKLLLKQFELSPHAKGFDPRMHSML